MKRAPYRVFLIAAVVGATFNVPIATFGILLALLAIVGRQEQLIEELRGKLKNEIQMLRAELRGERDEERAPSYRHTSAKR